MLLDFGVKQLKLVLIVFFFYYKCLAVHKPRIQDMMKNISKNIHILVCGGGVYNIIYL